MKNAVGREIPEYIENYGAVKPFEGAYAHIEGCYNKASAKNHTAALSKKSGLVNAKLLSSIEEAIEKSGLKDGMTVSFHHHMRNGDYVVNMVMEAIESKGIKDIHVAASGLFKCHEPLVRMAENGTIRKITLSTISPGPLAKAITAGKLKDTCVFQSHGGRPCAIEEGRLHIDVAFISAPCCDEYGNMNGALGKSACGVLSYAYADALYADKVVAITDNLVPFPACPIEISQEKVDYIVKVDSIGDPNGIAFGPAKVTEDPENLRIANMTAQLIEKAGYIKNGMSLQTGIGGTSIAVAAEVGKIMKEKNVKGSFGSGGITGFFVDMLEDGLFEGLLDTQSFDTQAIASVAKNKHHQVMGASQYANPHNRGALVNQLDVMILGATEIDTDFNINVVTGFDGTILSSSGGNQDCAAGAKLAIVVTNVHKKGLSVIRDRVTTVTTPGETVDAVVTDLGIAINPKRTDLLTVLSDSNLPIMTIDEMKKRAEESAENEHQPVEFEDRIVVLVEYRDGTVIDVVKKPKR